MDALSKYAQFLTRSQAPVMMDDGGVIMQLYRKKPKLETDMSFEGAEIGVPLPKAEIPKQQISPPKDLDVSEIVEMAVRQPESKASILDRYRSDFGTIYEMAKPDPARVQKIDQSLEEIRSKSRQRVQRPDFDAIRAKYEEQGPGDWELSDYLKAALLSVLPAMTGAALGGAAGAAGAAPASAKGMEYALRSREEAKKKGKDSADKAIQTALDIYKADQDMAGKELKMLLDRADLEIKLEGKLSEPTRKILEQALSSFGSIEASLYGTEMRDRSTQEGQLGQQAMAADRIEAQREAKGYELGLQKEQREADRALKKEQADADRALKKELADADRAARERMAKQRAAQQAKGKAEKPPTAGQGAAAGYAQRAKKANEILEMYEKTMNFDPTSGKAWVIGNLIPDSMQNVFKTSDQQKYDAARRDFLQAILRDETGAAIAAFEEAGKDKVLFLQPGERYQDVQKIKAQARRAAIAALEGKAGEKAMEAAKTSGPEIKRDPRVQKMADENGISYGEARQYYLDKGFTLKEE